MLPLLLLTAIAPPISPAEDAPEAAAVEKPLWEFVLFATAAQIPHYRGSDESEWYVVPLPYLIYRGDRVRVDREGLRGIFYEGEYFETDISLFGNPPVEDDNEAREGMEDLDPLFEAGPEIKWYFLGRMPPDELYLRAALRGVFSFGLDGGIDMGYEGLHGGVALKYDNNTLLGDQGIGLGLTIGLDWTDSRFNDYFYEVAPRDVRPGRPRYETDDGYAGFSVAVSVGKRVTDALSLGVYGRWDNIDGATFEESPLARRKDNYFFGTLLTWRIAASKRTVGAGE